MRIYKNLATFVTLNKPVNCRVDTRSRKIFHNSGFVGSLNDQALIFCNEYIATRIAIITVRSFVQKTGLGQINYPHQSPYHFALIVTNGCRHRDNGCSQHLADNDLANPGFSFKECGGYMISVHKIYAYSICRAGQRGNRRAIHAGEEHAAIEKPHKNRSMFYKVLQGCLVGKNSRGNFCGNNIQGIYAFVQFVIDVLGQNRDRCELLVTQL